jgi:hypothetical protein
LVEGPETVNHLVALEQSGLGIVEERGPLVAPFVTNTYQMAAALLDQYRSGLAGHLVLACAGEGATEHVESVLKKCGDQGDSAHEAIEVFRDITEHLTGNTPTV